MGPTGTRGALFNLIWEVDESSDLTLGLTGFLPTPLLLTNLAGTLPSGFGTWIGGSHHIQTRMLDPGHICCWLHGGGIGLMTQLTWVHPW